MLKSTLVVFLLFAMPAGATVVQRLDVGELTKEAVVVVHAEVVDRFVVAERGPRGEIYTRTVLEVSAYLKGAGPERVVVQQLGGRLGELEMHIEGNARLAPGDEVVAFLDVDPEAGLAYIVGLAQGVYQVRRGVGDVSLWRDLTGLAFYTSAGVVEIARDLPTPTLPALRAQVAGVLR